MEDHLQTLHQDQGNTIASHTQAAMAMARHMSREQTTFQKGDKVLLESTNLKLLYPYWKLAPKQEGPFTIAEVMGPVTYKLNLPKKWRIHPIFHAALLTAYWTTKKHSPELSRPPPELVKGEEEHKVKAILNHQTAG